MYITDSPSDRRYELAQDMAGLVDNPEYWRGRAEETRTLAESMKDEESKAIMLGVARDYERMAELAEQRLGRKTKD